MGAFDDLIPQQAKGGGMFADLIPGNGPSSGGVQDWEPQGYTEGQKAARVVGSGAQGFNDTVADIVGAPVDAAAWALRKVGVNATDPVGGSKSFKKGIDYVATLPGRAADAVSQGSFDPLTEDRTSRFEPVTTAEKTARGVGEGVANALSVVVPAGVVANTARAGTATQGVARTLASSPAMQTAMGAVGGGVTGATDNPWLGLGASLALPLGVGSYETIAQAVRNLAPNVDEASAKIIARAIVRDKMTPTGVGARQADLGAGTPLVEAGGPNLRSTMRGAIAAPGQARTTAQELFDARQAQTGDMAKAALDKNISPNGSVATTVDELAELRRQAATPAYEAAGIPRRPESRITAIDEPPTWNTRSVNSPELEALVKDSPDIRRALNTLRRFPDYKNVPADSMAMWDEAYKLLGGMEQSAVRAGENRKAMLIGDLRRDFQTALVDANPDYGRALKAYAGPSKLIDAAELGKEWFKPGVDPAVVIREFQALPAAEREAARVGVRDWARSAMDRTDRNSSGVALWSSPANRQKLQAILSPNEYTDLARSMDTVKNAAATRTDINVGSRTAPMLAEQADNAEAATSMFTDVLTGHPLRAASKFAGRAVERIAEGKTEKVNALVADWLSSTDPQKVGMVNALAERARLEDLARRAGRGSPYAGLTAQQILEQMRNAPNALQVGGGR